MEGIFLRVFNMSVTASYVLLALLVIRLLLKRAPKKYSYLLWSVAAFRLSCPVSFSSIFSLFNAKPFDMTIAQSGGGAALRYIPDDVGVMAVPKVTTGIPTMNAFVRDSLPAAAPAASVNPLQIWIFIGAILWFVGMAALLVYSVAAVIRLKRLVATAIRLKGNVYESDRIRSPFVLGFIQPRIYIPFGLGEKEKGYILKHESYHLKRKDHLIKPFAFLILAVHWFNPLVWLAFALMTRDMEMSCDEKVLDATGADLAKEYGMSLLAFAANRRFPAAGPLAFGEAGIRERVKNILRFRKSKRWVTRLAASVCMVAIAACAANPPANAPESNRKASITGTTAGADAFLKLQKDFKSGYDKDRSYNITPASIKENSDYAIFKYAQSCASFLLYGGKVYPMGSWLGGLGVTSMKLADLNGDGEDELYFTYSWGSGIHRSHAAYFDPVAKRITAFAYVHLNGDMIITDDGKGRLSLHTAAVSNMDDFVNFDMEAVDFIADIVFTDGQITLDSATK